MGPDHAGVLMELLPPVPTDQLVTKHYFHRELAERFNELTRTLLLALVPMWFTARSAWPSPSQPLLHS